MRALAISASRRDCAGQGTAAARQLPRTIGATVNVAAGEALCARLQTASLRLLIRQENVALPERLAQVQQVTRLDVEAEVGGVVVIVVAAALPAVIATIVPMTLKAT